MSSQLNARALSARLWRGWLKNYKTLIFSALFLSAITASAASTYALVLHYASGLLEQKSPDLLWIAPLALISVTGIRALSLYVQTLATNRLALSVMRDLQIDLYAHLISADYARISAEPVGSIISRFTNDITMLREGLIRASNNLMRDVLTIIGCLAVMIWLDWALTLAVLAVLIIAGQPILRIGTMIRRRADDVQSQMGDVSSFLEESFSGARMVKSFSLEDWAKTRSEIKFLNRFKLVLSMVAQRARIDPIMEFAGGIAVAILFGFAGWRAIQGETSLADLVAIIAAIGVMAPAARAVASLTGVLQEAFAVLNRVFFILDEQPKLTDKLGAPKFKFKAGKLEFNNVGFNYEKGMPVLKNVTLKAEPGQTIALVGPSGSGKTTLLNLLPRLYDVTEGDVLIDDQDVRGVTLNSLRNQIALVSQDVILFDDTIRANIALGRLGARDEDIINAAKAADAHDFIMQLDQGYDSPAGPKGGNLSGGQKQRIMIARALLKDAPILLLDEATSALDAGSESRVQAALDKLSENRTTLVIAHRLSTVRACDHIYVLKDGRVVEDGDHQSLIQAGGVYAELSQLQLK